MKDRTATHQHISQSVQDSAPAAVSNLSYAQTVMQLMIAEGVDANIGGNTARCMEIIAAYKGMRQRLATNVWQFPDDSALMYDQNGWWIGKA